MLRILLSIAAGYFSITVLNSFAHLIVSVYFKTEITLAGVANLPTDIWVIGFTALQLIFGLLGGLLATTLAKDNKHLVILGFILLMVAIGIVDYSVLNDREPLWYLITAPFLQIMGILSGYHLQANQQT